MIGATLAVLTSVCGLELLRAVGDDYAMHTDFGRAEATTFRTIRKAMLLGSDPGHAKAALLSSLTLCHVDVDI